MLLNKLLNFPERNPEQKFSIHQPECPFYLARAVTAISRTAKLNGYEIIVLCIGTDRSTGDALGPLTGSKLRSFNRQLPVYGTLDEPVHATNLSPALKHISRSHGRPFIVAVDACLGRLDSVGYVSVGPGPVKPGAAVNKQLPAVGDAYVTGIVNVGGFMEHLVLQSTRLNLVVKMADTIALAISTALSSG